MEEEFVSEPIKPVAGTFDIVGMARGEPGLPGRLCPAVYDSYTGKPGQARPSREDIQREGFRYAADTL